jgi:hypothetical protein
MAVERHYHGGNAAGVGGAFWFAGWLFTIGFIGGLVWWKIILAIVVWPFYLGTFLQSIR